MKDKTIYEEAGEVDAEDGIVFRKDRTPSTFGSPPKLPKRRQSASTQAP